jgi:two-component system sensor histidine kinase/response regulator
MRGRETRLRRNPGNASTRGRFMIWISILVLSAILAGSFTLTVLAWQEWNGRRRQRQPLRQRVCELEEALALQERKVKHLTGFAQQMQESEAGTRAIIDYALDGIITIDHLGCIIEFNPAAECLFGYEREEILGKPIVVLIPPQLRESQRCGWEQFLESGYGPWIGQRVETVGLRANGQEFPLELAITVLHPQQPPLLTAYVRDLSQLKQTAEKLSQSNTRLQAILDAATQAAIVATDIRGRITLFNRGAERMLGYAAEEIVGVHSPELFLSATELAAHARQLTEDLGVPLAGFAAFVERARREDHEEREWSVYRKDGSELTVNVAVTVLRNHSGEIAGYLAVITDVTSRRRAALALERAKEAAEAANRAKSDFLANMSHEIRTPMNGILGMTQLALDTDLNPEQREYLQMVKTSADGLLTVINDILDFSKIEAGKLELDPTPFELRDTLADTVRSLSLRAHAKNVELVCHVPADVPDYFVGDSIRLRQILINLVGNAIKFTERGEVVVRASVSSVEREKQGDEPAKLKPGGDIELHFAVADTGIGIAPQKLPYIFDPFVQADTSTTRKYGGTGLGLTITGRLVEMMGGRLWAESVPEQGSTFHFTLRLKLQDRSPSHLLPRRPRDLQGLAVLVVDDNATNRRILGELLASWLMLPTTVESARSALAALEAAKAADKPFPLVLLDAQMPEVDGFALAASIRARLHLPQPGLILLSSTDCGGDREKCRELGIGQRLTKPVKPSDLFDALLRTLDSYESNGVPPGEPPIIAHEPSSGAWIEMKPNASAMGQTGTNSLRVLLAEDNLVNQRVVQAIVEKLGHRVTTVATGAAAVRAVQQEPFDVVLMDVQMPEMNGLEAIRTIRAGERASGRHVPIVAMTAHAMKGAREDCFLAGMDEYLSKPIQVSELLCVLRKLTPERMDEPTSFDPRPLLQRINDDSDLFRELIRLFQEDCPRMLESIRTALQAGNAESLEQATHLLKGSAGNFAAGDVVCAAQQIETHARNGKIDQAREVYRALEEAVQRFCLALDEWLAVHPV